MALPNSDFNKIKVYPNEYINNITINRPNGRLLDNDLFLYNLMISNVTPATSDDPGELGERRIDEDYVYFYTGAKWVRIALDSSF
jgi:hypothetical protein